MQEKAINYNNKFIENFIKKYKYIYMKKTVVIGLLGSTLDQGGKTARRWERWRPSVALCQHEDLLIHRFELLYQRRFTELADLVSADIALVAPETELRLQAIEFDDPWDFEGVYSALFEFARTYPFDLEQEDYLIHISTGTHVAQICCFLLTEARYFPARLVQTSPPTKRHLGGPGTYRLIDLDLSRYDRIAQRFRREAEQDEAFLKAGIATRDIAFNALIARIEQVAIRSRAPLLLTGPTGAGKTQLARRIYELKQRRNQIQGPFVEVNCATLRGDAAMSALFGHVKGAFTGAQNEREGLLRKADQGLLFLDEIGELGLDEQTMLLRALEDKRFLPMGADVESSSDFQLIAGTNRELRNAVAQGRFRDDLLARINLWTFRLPGLAERRADLEPNLDYELERHSQATGQQVRFNKEARARFITFATRPEALWQGNFRDLAAAVTRLATLAQGGRITLELVEEEVGRLRSQWQPVEVLPDIELESLLDQPIDEFDAVQLREVIKVCRQSRNLSDAGRKLFAVSRAQRKSPNDADRLRKYLAKFRLDWEQVTS